MSRFIFRIQTRFPYLLWVDDAENVHPREKALLLLLPVLDKSLVGLEAGDEVPLLFETPVVPGTASEDRKFVEFVQASFIWRLLRMPGCPWGGVVQGLKLMMGLSLDHQEHLKVNTWNFNANCLNKTLSLTNKRKFYKCSLVCPWKKNRFKKLFSVIHLIQVS